MEPTWRLRVNAAARAAGVSRWTIHRHLGSGKLSFTLDGRGRRVVDVSELQRVYGELTPPGSGNGAGAGRVRPPAATATAGSGNVAAAVVDVVRRLEAENDRLRADMGLLRSDLEAERVRSGDLQAALLEQVHAYRTLTERLQLTDQRPQARGDGEREPARRRARPRKSPPPAEPVGVLEAAAAGLSQLLQTRR